MSDSKSQPLADKSSIVNVQNSNAPADPQKATPAIVKTRQLRSLYSSPSDVLSPCSQKLAVNGAREKPNNGLSVAQYQLRMKQKPKNINNDVQQSLKFD